MELWEYAILFLSVMLGGGAALLLKKNNKEILQLVLAFTGAYIMGLSVLHLMPTVFASTSHTIGLWVLLGFFVQLLLEQLSAGIEHGHIHVHEHGKRNFAIQVMLGLCIHAFIEGLPLSGYEELHALMCEHHHEHAASGGNFLLFGIIMHKIPAAFALGILLMLSGFSKKVVFGCLFLFASMSPLGAAIPQIMNAGSIDPKVMNILTAIVVGSFLHIATTILFEQDSSHQHKIPIKKLGAIAAGLIAAIITL